MDLYEFNVLDLNTRADMVWNDGTYVCTDANRPSNFYTLGNFYVEVVLDRTTNAIVEVASFRVGEHYDRMIAHMDLVNMFDWRPMK